MALIQEGRNFRLVPESELPEISNILEGYLPESLTAYYTIKIYLTNRISDFHFYISKQWPECPLLIQLPGSTKSPDNNIYQNISIFCPIKNLECLNQLETEDVLIDWKKRLHIHFTHTAILDRLESFYKSIGSVEQFTYDILILNKNAVIEVDEFPDDEAELRPLTEKDVQHIYDHYRANDIESIEMFKAVVRKLPTLGVFRKDTNELAAWMLCSYFGTMFSMQTLPMFRRKGYGLQIAKVLTKQVIDMDYIPHVSIRTDNIPSHKLYTALGFEKHYQMSRVKIIPNISQEN